jgi:hypothetical protein
MGFKINKRGMMVKFLVTIVFAILLFSFACSATSKIFTVSGQSKKNFGEFVTALNQFDNAQINDHKTEMLILDKESAFAYFEEGSDKIEVSVDVECAACSDYKLTFKKPSSCSNKQCVCFLDEFDYESNSKIVDTKIFAIANKVDCTGDVPALKMPICGFGKNELVNSYSCLGGFVIERDVAEGEPGRVDRFFSLPRRNPILLIKEGDAILLEG